MVSDKELIQWNREGLIPGPKEEENSFLDRVNYCHTLDKIEEALPFKTEEKHSSNNFSEGFELAKSLFDITPSWIPIYTSNYKLSPWHGGCAWIFQMDERSPTAALLQLRQAFRKSAHYLKIYSRDELIAHELAHVGRMTFQEPIFEEFHAYQTATSRFRRWFGPLFRSSRETLYFLVVLLVVLFLNLTMVGGAEWLNTLPLLLIVGALARLWWNQREYARCLEQLEKLFPGNGQKVIYRLTDREIKSFGRMNVPEIRSYIEGKKSLRWKAIRAVYLHAQ